ncbi:MAG: FlgD immunoglobulin-like domain containing protein [Candidatus Zixiibacteriota bacterium]
MKYYILAIILLISSLSFGQWLYEDLIVSVPDDDFVFDELKFGTSGHAENGHDPMDQASPPAPPSGVFTAFQSDDSLVNFLTIDFKKHVPEPDTLTWEIFVRATGLSAVVSWNTATLPDHPSISLEMAAHYPGVEPGESDYVDMHSVSELDLLPAQMAQIRLVSIDAVKENVEIALPDKLIEYIAPNPFNSAAHISLKVAKSSNAKVTIYDLIGNQIQILHDGHLDRGNHIYKWYGKDAAGNLMPSGIYFLKVNTETSSDCSRLIYMK